MSRYAPRVAGVAVAVGALVAIWYPLAASTDLRESQAAVAAGDLDGARAAAESAVDAQPYAADALLQKAIVLELQGELEPALAAAAEAAETESENWRTWTVLSRLEAKTGDAEASVAALREARELNPRSLGRTTG